MKDFLKTMARLALLLVWFVLPLALQGRDDNPYISIHAVGEEKKVSLVLKNLKAPATVRLESTRGILLEEEVTKEEYAKVFNLNELEDGNYKLVILTGVRETEQPIAITRTGLSMNINERQEFFTPTLRMHDQLLDLSMLNNHLTSFTLQLEDAEGNLVFEDVVRNVVKVEKRYNLSQLPDGEYTVIMKVGEKFYTKTIRK